MPYDLNAPVDQLVVLVIEQDGGEASGSVYGLEPPQFGLDASKCVGAFAQKLYLGREAIVGWLLEAIEDVLVGLSPVLVAALQDEGDEALVEGRVERLGHNDHVYVVRRALGRAVLREHEVACRPADDNVSARILREPIPKRL